MYLLSLSLLCLPLLDLMSPLAPSSRPFLTYPPLPLTSEYSKRSPSTLTSLSLSLSPFSLPPPHTHPHPHNCPVSLQSRLFPPYSHLMMTPSNTIIIIISPQEAHPPKKLMTEVKSEAPADDENTRAPSSATGPCRRGHCATSVWFSHETWHKVASGHVACDTVVYEMTGYLTTPRWILPGLRFMLPLPSSFHDLTVPPPFLSPALCPILYSSRNSISNVLCFMYRWYSAILSYL